MSKSLEINRKMDMVADMISAARKLVIFTGAGVSTESGIPDFRSPGGIWSKFDPDDFTIQKYTSDCKTRLKQWTHMVDDGLMVNAMPNRAHSAIAELEKLGKLGCVVTQNVDNLHQKAGNSPDRVFELHGTMGWARCMQCGERFPIERVLDRFRQTHEMPVCENCFGMLKPDVIFFGEALPEETLHQAISHSRDCDLFIVIGSSLVVYPAAFMPIYAKESGAKLVIINISRTELDEQADIIINGQAGEIMETITAKVKSRL